MKKILFITALALGFFSCSQNDVIETPDQLQKSGQVVTKAGALTYKLERTIQNDGLETAFKPGPMCVDGDKVFITNVANGIYSIRIYSLIQASYMYGIINSQDWHGSSELLQDKPIAMCAYGGKIFLAVQNKALVYVINASAPYNLITTIGTGVKASYPVVAGQECMMGNAISLAVANDKLLVRDENILRTYNLSDITTENSMAVPRYNSSAEYLKTTSPFGLQTSTDEFGRVFLSDFTFRKIYQTLPVGDLAAGDSVKFFPKNYVIDIDHSMENGMTAFAKRIFYTNARAPQVFEATEDGVVMQNVGDVAGYKFENPTFLANGLVMNTYRKLLVADTDRVLVLNVSR